MEKLNFLKKIITLKVAAILILLLITQSTAQAEDVPVDIDAIRRRGMQQQGVIVMRQGIYLFNEKSEIQLEAHAARQERRREEAEQILFDELHILTISDPYEALRNAALENNIFERPMQTRVLTHVEEREEMPLWGIVITLVGAACLGLIIAIWIKNQKKERKSNVYHNHP